MKIKNLFKKVIITMCSSAMIMGIGAVGVNAADGTSDDFTVSRTRSGYSYVVSVSAYNGQGGAITLPTSATINSSECTVTSVGSEVFKENTRITDVVIPEGYDTIETSAFEGCTNLKSVKIPGSMTMISASAFKGCPNLETITFADDTASSLTFRNDIFANCTSLASINLPKRLSSVNNNFLRGCTSLTTVTIADGAEKFVAEDNILYDISGDTTAAIVVYPFGKAETEFTIPSEIKDKTVAEIAMHLFRENGTLQKITVPDTVTTIGGFAFNDMTAVQEIVLEQTAAPALGSYTFAGLPSGSKIIVKNDDVANKIKSGSNYYTPENTAITVAGQTPETKTVSAAFSIAAEDEIKDGKAVYGIYLDNAENVNTVLLKVSFDSAQVDEGTFTVANSNFNAGTSTWTKKEDGKLILKVYAGITGNVSGFSTEEKTKLAEIAVPLKDGTKGNVTAKITAALTGGVVSEVESAMGGTVTFGTASASVFIQSYDVNNDGKVNIIDITEAQRYYKAKSTDANWETAKAMDVNNDKKVDIEDYIAIFNNLSDF